MERCVDALKRWTGKARATIVYDSTVDPFTGDGLFEKVKGKPNIAVVGFTTDGDVFGGYYSVAVTEQRKWFKDPDMFVFSFESRGRCATPQKFRVKEGWFKDWGIVMFWKNYHYGFVWFGVLVAALQCGFWLGNEESDTNCFDMSYAFEGLKDTTLTGKDGSWDKGPARHHCTRLVAVQLE